MKKLFGFIFSVIGFAVVVVAVATLIASKVNGVGYVEQLTKWTHFVVDNGGDIIEKIKK